MKDLPFHRRQSRPIEGQMLTTEPITKREFMQQYVLNRAACVTGMGGLAGAESAKEAGRAWDIIETECAK